MSGGARRGLDPPDIRSSCGIKGFPGSMARSALATRLTWNMFTLIVGGLDGPRPGSDAGRGAHADPHRLRDRLQCTGPRADLAGPLDPSRPRLDDPEAGRAPRRALRPGRAIPRL